MAISAAFGQLLALETDNVKHLQEAMTKVLHEMPMSERKGLVQCLVYQKDNLATCLAFPNLGECLFLNDRFLRERGIASTPRMEYQVFLCIFQKNLATATLGMDFYLELRALGLKEMGKIALGRWKKRTALLAVSV